MWKLKQAFLEVGSMTLGSPHWEQFGMKHGRVRDHRNDAGTLPLHSQRLLQWLLVSSSKNGILVHTFIMAYLVLTFAILSFLLCVFTYL